MPGPETYIESPKLEKDPVRFFQNQPTEAKLETVVLNVAFAKTREDGSLKNERSLSIQVPLTKSSDEYSDATRKKLINFAKILYHVYVFPLASAPSKLNFASMEDLDGHAFSDSCFLVETLVGIGTGKGINEILPLGSVSNAYQRSSFLSFWTAAEMMRRGISTKPGILQDILQKHLSTYQAPQAVLDLLTRYRIAASRQRTRLKDIEAVNRKIEEGWKIDRMRYGLVFIIYDNLGFRILGARAGYDQYTMILVFFISPEQLKELGFYQPCGSLQPPISRKRLVWNDIRSTVRKEDILPCTEHYTYMSEQILAEIDGLLCMCNRIPSLADIKDFLAEGSVFVADTRLVTSHGTQNRREQVSARVEVEVEEEEQGDPEEDTTRLLDPCIHDAPTMYECEGQRVEIDLPMRADLNKKDTCKGLAQGALHTRERILDSGGEFDTDEPPVMENCGIATGGDGSPSYTFDVMAAADPMAYEHLKNHTGGFHQCLNTHQSIGTRFADTHLRDFIHPFRNTDPKKEWFLFPGDPGQTQQELPEMTAAHYVTAARHISKKLNGEAVSAVDVHNHMLERSGEHDICMVTLMWLHFVAIADMIRDSEKENDPELYQAGARLALLLYVKTHSTKYVRLGVSFWIYWSCASDADKVLYNSFYFTKKTANGKFIWVDRFEEWFNLDVRSYLGKYAKPNQEMLLQRTALMTKERRRWKAAAAAKRRGNKKSGIQENNVEKSLAVSPIFCHQMILIDRWNLWGTGPVLVGSGETLEEPKGFCDPSGKNLLYPNLLFDVSSAQDTLMAYLEHNHLQEDPNTVHRSEKAVSLRMTPALLKDVKQARLDEFERLTSTDKEKLATLTTVEYLKTQLVQLRARYPFLRRLAEPTWAGRKPELAEDLAKHHKCLIAKERGYKSRVKSQLLCTAELGTGFACPNKKKEELKLMFYSLTDEAKQHFIDKKYKVESDSSDGNDGCTDSDDEEDGPGTDIELVDEESRTVLTPDRGQRNINMVATPFMERPPRMSL
jgi:hypothetical protein